ncbi:MAG: hypothetical protein AAB074_15550 [Planctomycetota bacterium]
MTKRAVPVLTLIFAACMPATPPQAKVTMAISVRVSENADVAAVSVNGQPRGKTPLELDALTLPFDAAIKPRSWPPPGAQVFSPTSTTHGKQESSFALAIAGDIVYVRTLLHGAETIGAVRLSVAGANGASLEFDSAEKELNSSIGRAEHKVRLYYKARK